MALFTMAELKDVIGAKVLAGEGASWAKRRIRYINLDSRAIHRGDVFLALAGDRFDGHDFVATALTRGAVGAIVRESFDPATLAGMRGQRRKALCILAVPDTLVAYQQLASYHRRRFNIPVVAITGSNGKTTTKDMVASVLAQRRKILKTEGNLNNRLGVPQTLFRLSDRHTGAVIEMGVDNLGQTTRLCEIAQPTIGVITNIGPDHLEFFGSLDGSAQAKAELLEMLPRDGAVVLNADDSYYADLAKRVRCRVVSFGFSPTADVRAIDVRSDDRNGTTFRLLLPGKVRGTNVRIRVQGNHNVANAMAAGAVGSLLRLPGTVIAKGLSRFKPAAMRSQVSVSQGVKIIVDCYNANPASMKAAVQLLAQTGPARKRVAVLGDMLELGPNAVRMHEEVGAFVAEQRIDQLVACGTLGRSLARGAIQAGLPQSVVREVSDAAAAASAVKAIVKPGDVVLVKASRGMKLELVVDALQKAGRTIRKAS